MNFSKCWLHFSSSTYSCIRIALGFELSFAVFVSLQSLLSEPRLRINYYSGLIELLTIYAYDVHVCNISHAFFAELFLFCSAVLYTSLFDEGTFMRKAKMLELIWKSLWNMNNK